MGVRVLRSCLCLQASLSAVCAHYGRLPGAEARRCAQLLHLDRIWSDWKYRGVCERVLPPLDVHLRGRSAALYLGHSPRLAVLEPHTAQVAKVQEVADLQRRP